MSKSIRATVVFTLTLLSSATYAGDLKSCNFTSDCGEGEHCSLTTIPTPEKGSAGFCYIPNEYDENHNVTKQGTFNLTIGKSNE